MGQRAALMNLALTTFERADLPRARELAQGMLQLSQDIADASASTVRCVEIASEILQACGAAETVVRLEGAANTQREALGAPMPRTSAPSASAPDRPPRPLCPERLTRMPGARARGFPFRPRSSSRPTPWVVC
jgi:hypothetical protein